MGRIEGANLFPPIGPFSSGRFYYIQYPESYQRKLKSENSFFAGRGLVRPPSPGVYELDRLVVTVGFRSRPSRATRLAFADAITAWAQAAGEHGAFDDGPVALASPGVSFNGVRAWFQLDAGRSGQDTLNWLALTVLDFGEDVHTTTEIRCGEDPAILDLCFGPIRGEIVVIGFGGDRREEVVAGSAESAPTSHVPPGAKRARGVRSARFPVLELPYSEWDRFEATVYFGRAFQREEQELLIQLLDAWLLLASYGDMGGVGSHGADPVRVDEATDSAIISADMGDVDPRIALKILINALEGFEGTGPAIEAVVFGRPSII